MESLERRVSMMVEEQKLSTELKFLEKQVAEVSGVRNLYLSLCSSLPILHAIFARGPIIPFMCRRGGRC